MGRSYPFPLVPCSLLAITQLEFEVGHFPRDGRQDGHRDHPQRVFVGHFPRDSRQDGHRDHPQRVFVRCSFQHHASCIPSPYDARRHLVHDSAALYPEAPNGFQFKNGQDTSSRAAANVCVLTSVLCWRLRASEVEAADPVQISVACKQLYPVILQVCTSHVLQDEM